MSQQQRTGNSDQSGPYFAPTTQELTGEPLPEFRPFPARAHARSGNSGHAPVAPTFGSTVAQHDVQPSAILGPSGHMQDSDDINTTMLQRAPARSDSPQLQQTFTLDSLPEFTPFPAASRPSRYAPQPGSRLETVRSSSSSSAARETTTSRASTSTATMAAVLPPVDPIVPGPSPVVRAPSGPAPVMPSYYAPPGSAENLRPHVCEICSSGFARAHDLKRHIETHKGDRPYPCPKCGRGFSRKDAVQRHLLGNHCGPTAGPSGSGSSK